MKTNDTDTNGLRVLVVDDDVSGRAGLVRLLRRLRLGEENRVCRVMDVSNGDEGLRVVKESGCDCVLLDYRMPGGDGLFWLDRLLAQDAYLAVVMVTGEGSEAVAVDAMKKGAMDYLVKGMLTMEHLERAIRNAVEKSSMRRMLERQRQELIDAERHRVMIESLGAACHHLGQPVTVITGYLHLMKRLHPTGDIQQMIEECQSAAAGIADILDRLQKASVYHTEPYLTESDSDRILKV